MRLIYNFSKVLNFGKVSMKSAFGVILNADFCI